jgi:predicted small lipoprotein YifL
MNARTHFTALSLLAALTLAACGGGGGSSPLVPPSGGGNSTQSTQAQTEDSIDTTNDVGAPVKDFATYDEATGSPLQSVARTTDAIHVQAAGDGTCNNGVEFFAPDKKGDANSTERIDFYDNGCTAIARDAVRIFTSTGANSETVQRTVSLYALNSSTPSAVRSETVNYRNATFDQYGYPVVKDGFARTHTGELDVSGAKTIVADGELVVAPSSGSSTTFCSDSAGFNATGIASLSETFGWAGVMPSGTRTANSDGTVTWNTTHTGSTYTGAIGGLSIQSGVQNTSCPIATPMFTLAGGTLKGTYNLPVSATFSHGILTNLTIQNATLANGDTLNVQTNSGVQPGDPHFISGTLSKSGSQIAAFNVDAFGDGVLVVSASGKQYQIEDWHVVK